MAPISRWRLGLFVLLVLGAIVAASIGVGAASTHHPTVSVYTYFDESVSGLDTGGPVKFRGVNVGSVSSMSIAPDERHIEVKYKVDVDALGKMGIQVGKQGGRVALTVPPALRAELGGNGLTGTRYVEIDLVNPAEKPPPQLSFPAQPNTIPAAPGTMKTLQDAVMQVADEVRRASARVDRFLAEVEHDQVADKAAAMLVDVSDALQAVEATARRIDRERVPEATSQALQEIRATTANIDRVVGQLEGEHGLIASIGRATDAFGQAGRGISGSTRDLDQALDELRDTAAAIRMLAEDLDHDPDMLLKGRARRSSR